jgi:hypothetical protein
MLDLFRWTGQTREKSALVTRRFGASENELTPTAQAHKARGRDLHRLRQLKLDSIDIDDTLWSDLVAPPTDKSLGKNAF